VLMDALLPFPDAMHSVVAAISRIEPQLPAVQVFRVPARVEPEPPEPVDAE